MLSLPKWPQMYTTGRPVTIAQAKEIIRRTDDFFNLLIGGNNHDYNKRVRRILGMPKDFRDEERPWQAVMREEQAFRDRWGAICTEFVFNSWISCSYIHGPHGWCHPDGQIGFIDNVGKWPEVADILEEWCLLSKTFPFLDIGVTLMNGEFCNEGIEPVASIRVLDGVAEITNEDVHSGHPPATRGNKFDNCEDPFIARFHDPDAEQGIPWEWIEEWAESAGQEEKGSVLRNV